MNNPRIIGGMTRKCAQLALSLYQIVVKGECHVTNARTAEMSKLTENAFRDVNIAFANELSFICDKFGINVWELIRLANLHPRVNILRPGPGVGGHCIAVDPWFIVDGAPDDARLIRASREINDSKPDFVVRKVKKRAAELRQPVIACLGLAYKADVDDLRESPAVEVVQQARPIEPRKNPRRRTARQQIAPRTREPEFGARRFRSRREVGELDRPSGRAPRVHARRSRHAEGQVRHRHRRRVVKSASHTSAYPPRPRPFSAAAKRLCLAHARHRRRTARAQMGARPDDDAAPESRRGRDRRILRLALPSHAGAERHHVAHARSELLARDAGDRPPPRRRSSTRPSPTSSTPIRRRSTACRRYGPPTPKACPSSTKCARCGKKRASRPAPCAPARFATAPAARSKSYVLHRADAVAVLCEGVQARRPRPRRSGRQTLSSFRTPSISRISRPSAAATRPWRTNWASTAPIVLGFIGSFYEYEGLDVLLNALPQALQQVPNLKLLLVGGGPHEAELKRLAAANNIEEPSIFTGRVPVRRGRALLRFRRSLRLSAPQEPPDRSRHAAKADRGDGKGAVW